MNKGWISVHRSLLDHPFWVAEKFTKAQAWLDLMLNANHKENRVMIKGQIINIERGQQIRSQVTLAKAWKWDRKTVHRFLKLLENDSMIVQHSTHLTTIITICNYKEYQDIDNNSPHVKGQLEGHVKGQAVPKCRGTDNNDNNGNNVNNVNKKAKKPSPPKIEKPEGIEEQVWQDWLTLRKQKKAAVTITVLKGATKEAGKAGVSLNEFLEIWCRRGSQGLEASWIKPDEKAKSPARSNRRENIMAFVHGDDKRDEKVIEGESYERK